MFNAIKPEPLPKNAILARYKSNVDQKTYLDCFKIDIDQKITLPEYIEAFYTSPLFKIERLILAIIGHSSSDLKVKQLADGSINNFAAWHVEERNVQQILLGDFTGRTRSWLMIKTIGNGKQARLYFGTAVIHPVTNITKNSPSFLFSILSYLHIFYSKSLLSAAYRQLIKKQKNSE